MADPNPDAWRCDYAIGDDRTVHVRPRGDGMWHDADDDCPCGPQQIPIDDADFSWLVLHHALDGRPRPTGGFTPNPGPTGHSGDCGGLAA